MGRREADHSAAAFLERLVTQYPYCQAGQMLYARALKKAADPSFDQQMNRAMAAAPDRRHFRYFLSGRPEPDRIYHRAYDPEEISYSAPARETGVGAETTDPGRATGSAESAGHREASASGASPDSGSGPASDEKPEHKIRQQAIIDRFLRKNPRIEALKDEIPVGEMAPESLDDHPELISETLAEIHIKQGKTDRAIDIYKKLSLKFPEKSSYFAKKIESIERKTK